MVEKAYILSSAIYVYIPLNSENTNLAGYKVL